MYQQICLSIFLVTVCLAVAAADHFPSNALGGASALQAISAIPKPTAAARGDSSSHYDASRGRTLYSTYCESCHQATGEGLPGTFPPLKGSAVVNRDDATKHLQVVLQGLQGARVSGVRYPNPMPAFASTLSDAEIATIVDYERTAWGNHGKLVSAAQVSAERRRAK